MITRTFAHELARCQECGSFIIYKPAIDGFPAICNKCGVPHNVSLTPEQRKQMEQAQEQRNQGPQGFSIRFG